MAVYGASRPEEIPLGRAFVEPILFCSNCQRTEYSTDRSVYEQSEKGGRTWR